LLASAVDDAIVSEPAIGRVVDALADGRDDGLDVRWRLVDGEGRPIGLTEKDIRAALDRRPNGAGKERKPGEERKPGKERNR
jgi:hypothetical protein